MKLVKCKPLHANALLDVFYVSNLDSVKRLTGHPRYFSSHNPPYDSYSAFGTSYNPGDVAANGGLYNRLGRGIPDVSANGDNITMIYQGQKALAAGSSASEFLTHNSAEALMLMGVGAPMFAAIINRVSPSFL